MGSWRAAGVIVVSTLVLAGCGRGLDTYVKEYEPGDVEVKSCHKIGETITDPDVYPADAQDGNRVDEVWKCMIREQTPGSLGFMGRCYVVHESKVKTIIRGVKCVSFG
jgi:hypothetical protein